jgi:hypothetical protein
MCGIFQLLDVMCFMIFLTTRGGTLSFFSRALSICLCMAPCTFVVMVISGLTFHPTIFLHLNERAMFVFFCFSSSYDNI